MPGCAQLGCTRSRTGVWCQHIGCCTVPSLLHPNIRIISKNNYDVPMVFIDPGTDDNFSLSIFVFYLHSKNVFLSNLTSIINAMPDMPNAFPNFLKIHSAANYISLIMQFIVYCFYKYTPCHLLWISAMYKLMITLATTLSGFLWMHAHV